MWEGGLVEPNQTESSGGPEIRQQGAFSSKAKPKCWAIFSAAWR